MLSYTSEHATAIHQIGDLRGGPKNDSKITGGKSTKTQNYTVKEGTETESTGWKKGVVCCIQANTIH